MSEIKRGDRLVPTYMCTCVHMYMGGARGVMVIIAGYGHGDTSSNPGPD